MSIWARHVNGVHDRQRLLKGIVRPCTLALIFAESRRTPLSSHFPGAPTWPGTRDQPYPQAEQAHRVGPTRDVISEQPPSDRQCGRGGVESHLSVAALNLRLHPNAKPPIRAMTTPMRRKPIVDADASGRRTLMSAMESSTAPSEQMVRAVPTALFRSGSRAPVNRPRLSACAPDVASTGTSARRAQALKRTSIGTTLRGRGAQTNPAHAAAEKTSTAAGSIWEDARLREPALLADAGLPWFCRRGATHCSVRDRTEFGVITQPRLRCHVGSNADPEISPIPANSSSIVGVCSDRPRYRHDRVL